ncbi:MAG: hypothetical protein M3362_28360 [Acidobacteriota bacterium]|nr:hypothetical protein [Acidobacteriota bacterium]
MIDKNTLPEITPDIASLIQRAGAIREKLTAQPHYYYDALSDAVMLAGMIHIGERIEKAIRESLSPLRCECRNSNPVQDNARGQES